MAKTNYNSSLRAANRALAGAKTPAARSRILNGFLNANGRGMDVNSRRAIIRGGSSIRSGAKAG